MADRSDVVHGYSEPHDSFAVANRGHLHAVVDDIAVLEKAHTIGELRASLALLGPARQYFDENDLGDFDADEHWAYEEFWAVSDGDWPPMPTDAIWQVFPRDDQIWEELRAVVGVEVHSTALNGAFVWIHPRQEERLLEVFARHGVSLARDDDLILSASMYGAE